MNQFFIVKYQSAHVTDWTTALDVSQQPMRFSTYNDAKEFIKFALADCDEPTFCQIERIYTNEGD